MTDKMKEFLDLAEQDAALAERLAGAEGPEAVLALAKEKGFALTEADLAVQEAGGELSDEALEDVAGGMILNPLGAWTALSSLLLRRFGGGRAKKVAFRSDGTAPAAQTLEYRGGAPAAQTLQYQSGVGGPTLTNLTHFTSEEAEAHKLYHL